jgi:hypothetical protein
MISWHSAFAIARKPDVGPDEDRGAADSRNRRDHVSATRFVTAGHAPLHRPSPGSYVCVFDFLIHPDEHDARESYTDEQVYAVTSVVSHHAEDGDWAILTLDRNVARAPLDIGADVQRGDSIYILGHPMSLPLKYFSGHVTCQHPHFFTDASHYAHVRPAGDARRPGPRHPLRRQHGTMETTGAGDGWSDAFADPPPASQRNCNREFRLAEIADQILDPAVIRAGVPRIRASERTGHFA